MKKTILSVEESNKIKELIDILSRMDQNEM